MAKWISSKINASHKTSVMKQLVEAHQICMLSLPGYFTLHSKTYLYEGMKRTEKMSVKCLTQTEVIYWNYCTSDVKTFPGLEKLQSILKCHAQWTSPSIQNEILDISSFVIERIIHDVLFKPHFALIMDETSDITLRNCRNEKCFKLLWNRAKIMSDEIKGNMKESDFVFKEARAPRNKPSCR